MGLVHCLSSVLASPTPAEGIWSTYMALGEGEIPLFAMVHFLVGRSLRGVSDHRALHTEPVLLI